ncbi:efflux RND transporter periplasmic adaptor subunit [Polaromonas sp.]|uniref:efflux RND transporter periplasmic adaptor subunit n=1 Tax=Polaromonas sp. TaxID=1869339 RepID=UPI00248A2C10|nr:efflux RND transporter periplasmic adaptor subunit [Polaromonas sp.]MDI1274342.1 efflux RND transporter periplasmic adaptor subunit [Polaromonas sp.]
MNLAHTLSLKRGWIWMGVVAIVVGAAGVAWFVQKSPRVDVLELRYAPLVRTLQFSARVATLSRVDVGSTVTGRVARVAVDEGAQVRAGDVLVQLETDELRAAVAQAVAAERQAEATLQAARATLRRVQPLVAQGFYSTAQLDDAQRAVDVALAQQGSVRAATAAARARLTQTAVLAPTDARVLTRAVEPGQIVQPGKALMSLALAGPTQLTAQVDERFLDQLQPGQKAAVVADAFADQRFAARVLSIAPAVDAQRGAIEIKFALEQQAPAFLREDMTLSVEVETGRRERALVLPLSALRTQPSATTATVLVADAGRAQERKLRLGLRTLDAVEVLEGLAEGDAVLLGGSVPAGARIRARPVAWTPGQPVARAAATSEAGSAMSNAMGR